MLLGRPKPPFETRDPALRAARHPLHGQSMYRISIERYFPTVLALLGAGTVAFAAGCGSNPVGQSSDGLAAESAPSTPLPAPAAPVEADVRFSIDSRSTHAISPFVYGLNGYHKSWSGAETPANLTLSRAGGNRWSAYNWENNASNAGSDWQYSNDSALGGGSVPGEALRPRVQGALDRGAGAIVTVPMIGYVSADKSGAMGTDEAGLATRLATRFRESRPRKGSAFSMTPDASDRYVYQDEFAWWVAQSFPHAMTDPKRPIMFSLDNEPDIWHETHEEIRSDVGGKPNLLTYEEMVQRTVAYASAIKAVAPGAPVLGGVVATWSGAQSLGRPYTSPDPAAGRTDFTEYFLRRLREASESAGRRLVDAIDVHWYTEVRVDGKRLTDDTAPQTPATIQARLQAPRSLWDPTYDEKSWVNQAAGGNIYLIPRLRQKIAAHYPGTKIAITEYYYGRGGDISGGIAQADVLGIFGREGVYAANAWPLANLGAYGGDATRAYAYLFGAFKMFRDYDGQRGSFGDTGLSAATSDVARTSVYASMDAGHPERVVVVAINKTDRPLTASIALSHSRALSRAEVYTLTDGTPNPSRQPDLTLPQGGSFAYTLPPMSVSTLVLR